MKITFANGKMIVTHPSGIVCEYTVAQLQQELQRINAKIDDLLLLKTEYERYISTVLPVVQKSFVRRMINRLIGK